MQQPASTSCVSSRSSPSLTPRDACRVGATRSINSLNATNMVTFEMVELVMAWTTQTSPLLNGAPSAGAPGDADWAGLRVRALRLLSDKLESTDQNGRYVALKIINNVSRLPGGLEVVRANLGSIMKNLDDPDISVKRRCIDLLFVIADSNSSQEIVEKLLKLLKLDSSQVPDNLREELVLKTAIIAERNARDLRWYLGVILRLLETSGKFVLEDVWHRAVHIVTNNPKLQQYAASQAIRLIEERPAELKAVQLASYLLGEFGYLLTSEPEIGTADMDILTVSGFEQYEFLRQHFQDADNYTGALLMTTFAKMSNLYGGEVAAEVDKLFVHLEKHWAIDVQQRAIEYRRIRSGTGGVASEEILREMPLYAEKDESALLRRLRELTIENNEDENITFADTMSPKVAVNGNGAAGGGDDLLGLSSTAAPAATAPVASAAVQAPGGAAGAAGAAKFRDLVWKTYLQRQGGLYDDANIQILSQQRTSAAQAKVFICIKNKTAGQLTGVDVAFPAMQGVRMRVESLQPTIAAAGQTTAMIHVDCYGPLTDFPTVTVSGTAGGRPLQATALLPVRGTSFVSEPAQSLTYDVFVSKWQEWGGDQAAAFALSAAKILQSAPEVERATAGNDVTAIKKQLVRYLGMEVIINMNYDNETFSMGGFFSVLKEDSQQSKVGVLFSFKIQGETVQCAVRTGHSLVTSMLQGELSEIYGHPCDDQAPVTIGRICGSRKLGRLTQRHLLSCRSAPHLDHSPVHDVLVLLPGRLGDAKVRIRGQRREDGSPNPRCVLPLGVVAAASAHVLTVGEDLRVQVRHVLQSRGDALGSTLDEAGHHRSPASQDHVLSEGLAELKLAARHALPSHVLDGTLAFHAAELAVALRRVDVRVEEQLARHLALGGRELEQRPVRKLVGRGLRRERRLVARRLHDEAQALLDAVDDTERQIVPRSG
eukprot:scaffold3953_cov236-Pinguiococcus_pyrenoidosus.AAC.3